MKRFLKLNQYNRWQSFYLFVTLITLFVDQMTKYWAQKSLLMYEPYTVNTFFSFTLARNTGAAFSFLDSAGGWQSLFLLCLNLIISAGIVIWLFQIKSDYFSDKLKSWGLSLILGGAIGNITDRINLGYVIDFLDVHVYVYHWPIFNVADSAVCIGVGLLIWGISQEK